MISVQKVLWSTKGFIKFRENRLQEGIFMLQSQAL